MRHSFAYREIPELSPARDVREWDIISVYDALGFVEYTHYGCLRSIMGCYAQSYLCAEGDCHCEGETTVHSARITDERGRCLDGKRVEELYADAEDGCLIHTLEGVTLRLTGAPRQSDEWSRGSVLRVFDSAECA